MKKKKKVGKEDKKLSHEEIIFLFTNISTFFVFVLCYINIGDRMKKMLSGIFIPILFAVMVGFVCGKIVYNYYRDSIYDDLSSSRLYLIENGEYTSYEDMREDNSSNNYVYYLDDEGYKTVVGITKNIDNVEKIKKLYNDQVKVNEYYINNFDYNDMQNEYDQLLVRADNVYDVKEVVDNILNLYRSDDSIRLVSIY